MLKKFYSR